MKEYANGVHCGVEGCTEQVGAGTWELPKTPGPCARKGAIWWRPNGQSLRRDSCRCNCSGLLGPRATRTALLYRSTCTTQLHGVRPRARTRRRSRPLLLRLVAGPGAGRASTAGRMEVRGRMPITRVRNEAHHSFTVLALRLLHGRACLLLLSCSPRPFLRRNASTCSFNYLDVPLLNPAQARHRSAWRWAVATLSCCASSCTWSFTSATSIRAPCMEVRRKGMQMQYRRARRSTAWRRHRGASPCPCPTWSLGGHSGRPCWRLVRPQVRRDPCVRPQPVVRARSRRKRLLHKGTKPA